ncbi:hypothetical protein [Flavobacterium eburneipallidum]|uniref:hypothetical protein n=1 Tax=Flavobacterium eburneipallidum TaxID=3003263 RepID=UPI002482425B|nr:hypothetical protein [Flavobacterium eburneipallidum]
MNALNIRYLILILSIIIYVISLNNDVFVVLPNEKEHYLSGFVALTCGWFGIFSGGLISICWFANPALFLSWFKLKKTKVSFIYSVVAFFFCILFVVLDYILQGVELNEYGKGFYFWMLSILIMFCGNLYCITRRKD